MAKLARDAMWRYPIRNLATRIVHDVPSKQRAAELGALYKWVRDNIRYRFDPLGMEWLQTPERTVLEQAGDCDDQSVLLAALAGTLGHRWRFRTVGTSPRAQKHVAVEAFDGAGWVSLDPVLEPPALSTAPRPDLGAFGHKALGADHIWNSEGTMLSGATTPRDRALWQWVAYYPPIKPAASYGNVPQPGAWTTRDLRYRSSSAIGVRHDRHGFRHVGHQRIVQSPAGQFPASSKPVTPIPGRVGEYNWYDDSLGAWGFLKKIGRAVGKVAKGAVRIAGKGLHAVGKLARSGILQTVANVVVPGSGVLLKAAGGIEGKAERAVRGLKRKAAPALSTAQAIATAAQHKPAPALKRKYSSNARQTWDAAAGVYRVFEPRSGMSGRFGALRPALSFSLGAATASQATAAVNAVKSFMRSSGNKAPQVALPAVRTFQAADGGLKADGLWGPNARTAAAYYLGANIASLPAVAAPYARTKVTWVPPGARGGSAAAAPKATAITIAPQAGPPAPAGADYVQVGTEKQNPGLPPLGAKPVAATSPAPAAVPVAVSPAAAPAGATHAIVDVPGGGQAIVPVAAPAAIASPPKAHKKRAAALAPAVVVSPPLDMTAVAPAALAPPPPAFPPPAGGSFGPGEGPGGATAGGEGDNKLVWAAIAYLWWQQSKRRRAA